MHFVMHHNIVLGAKEVMKFIHRPHGTEVFRKCDEPGDDWDFIQLESILVEVPSGKEVELTKLIECWVVFEGDDQDGEA